MRVSYKLVFHQSICISAIKRIHSTTATYISSPSFMCLCIPSYCDACAKSSALRVGMKHVFQNSTFASERPQVRTWGRQTCFFPQAPSNLVTPLHITIV